VGSIYTHTAIYIPIGTDVFDDLRSEGRILVGSIYRYSYTYMCVCCAARGEF